MLQAFAYAQNYDKVPFVNWRSLLNSPQERRNYYDLASEMKTVEESGGSPTLRLLPRAVQQLKFLSRIDMTSHFYILERTRKLI